MASQDLGGETGETGSTVTFGERGPGDWMEICGENGENMGKYGVRWFKMVLDGAGFRWL
jgi:hypothetical protein